MAREAVSAIPGIDQFKMSGTDASFTVKEGTMVNEVAIGALFEENGLEMTALTSRDAVVPKAVYMVDIEGLT